MEKKYLNEAEAAAFLGFAPITLYKRRHSKPTAKRPAIPYFRDGRAIFYDRDDLVAYRELTRVGAPLVSSSTVQIEERPK